MMPVYRYMDSNPHQMNQSPFPQHCFPGFEAVPSHLKVDPSKTPMMYESFPCNTNYGYYVPYHGCCNHGNFPGYYSFRPPFPHFATSPSPAFHHYPNYPTFPEAYPVYYAPHYSNEQPRYEYNKDAHANYRCCGCPNHPHGQKQDRSLKIEEQEPDAEKKGDGSVVPIQPRSYPYPIVWIPPQYTKNEEYGRSNDQPEVKPSKNLKPTDQQEPNSCPFVWIPPEHMRNKDYGKSNDQPEVEPSKNLKPSEQEPRVWNGWFPLDMNGLKSSMQGEGERKPENQQKVDRMRQFPFPIFWMPYDGKKQDDENQDKRRMITAPNHSKQAPVGSEFIPIEPSDHDARMEKPQLNKEVSDNENASETVGKTAAKKCIPVKQMEVQRDDDKSEGIEKRGRDVSVKHIEDSATKELGGTTSRRKSSSPPKTSKLPPVCLRVDPLPNKRNGNGSSRFPSPPKGEPEDKLTKASTAPAIKAQHSLDKVEPGPKVIKNIQVVEEKSMGNKAEECTGASPAQLPLDFQEVSGKPIIKRSEKDSHEIKTEKEKEASTEEVVGAEKSADAMKAANPAESAHGQCKAETKKLSDVEAAMLIQSAFRGFEVRKWEPLKKLRQIAKVREQVEEVRNRIQALESSSDLKKDDRQRLLIGEMIMNLLLKLDTIQGLHSSMRDARKSLVRELMALQEKLDSLTSKWAEEKAKQLGTAESADCMVDACRNSTLENESEKASADGISSFDDTNEKGNNFKEPIVDEKSNVEESTEPLNVDQALDGKTENGTTAVACHRAPRIQDGDVPSNLERTDPSSVLERKSNVDDFVKENDPGEDNVEELPKETTDHADAVCEEEEEIENSSGEKESDMPINPALPAEVENLRSTEKYQEIDLLEELPVGIIDEVGESNTICSTEGFVAEQQANEQSIDATSDICVKGQKENEHDKNPELEVEVEQTQEKEVNNDDKFQSVLKPEEIHSTVGEENNDEVHEEEDDYEAIPADSVASSESEAGSVGTQEKEVLFEEKKEVQQPVDNEDSEEIKIVSEKQVKVEEANMAHETADERVLVDTDALSKPNVEQELLPASPTGSQMSNHVCDIAKLGGDNNLIEENKKLREMMEKLMEAGKDQLTVISNLTGRLKELEEKLSRNKKLSKPRARYRKARYAPSYCKPVRARVAEAAM